jgi:predicted GNAT family acetyltransferase
MTDTSELLDLDDAAVVELDHVVWHSLTTTHARLAIGDDHARRFRTDVAGFAAVRDASPASWESLAAIVAPGEVVALSGADVPDPPAPWRLAGGGQGLQMVLRQLIAPAPIDAEIVRLGDGDVQQMLDLVELTKPGPFLPRTIELGAYFGIFDGDRLVAMAGERLQTPRHTEVSAVCTHPTVRGRGYAAALAHRVAVGIEARGQRPVLHLAATNDAARRVYERLGFVVRRHMPFVAVQRGGVAP